MTKLVWKVTSETRIGDDIDTMVITNGIDILVTNEESAYRRALYAVMRDYIRFTGNLVEKGYERPKVDYMQSERGAWGHSIHHFEVNENNPFEINNIVERYFVYATPVLD